MKNLFRLFALLLCTQAGMPVSLYAQQTAEIREIKLPYMSTAELAETVLPAGTLVYSESDPSIVYIGNGSTPGGVRVSPPTNAWNHIATQDIRLNGNRLQLGGGFSILQLGGFAAISGDGTISVAAGVSSWGDSVNPMIRLTGGNTLGEISAFTWDPIEAEFTATIVDAGTGAPTIQWTDDLVSGTWATHTATITGPSGGNYTAVFDIPTGATLAFFRASYPTGSTGKIELLNNTEINGTLSVSGAITGSLNSTNLVGNIPSALLPATVSQVEAEAGTVTDVRSWTPERVKQAVLALSPPQPRVLDYTLGYFAKPAASQMDWLLMARAVEITNASPGVAYARTVSTAEAVFTLQKNGTSIGTVTFAAATAAGTVAVTSDTTFAAGDRLEVVAPGTADATIADIQIVLRGTLQ